MNLGTFLGLLAFNLVWAAHPLVGKWLLADFTPLQAAWTRYATAFLGYLTFAFIRIFLLKEKKGSDFFIIPSRLTDQLLIGAIGVMTFCFSPLFHMTGLATSMATENSVIIATEPLITAFLAWLLLKESVLWFDLLGFLLAFLGFGFLAGLHPSSVLGEAMGPGSSLSSEGGSHFLGNLLIVLSVLGESSFTIFGKKLVRNYSPMAIFGSAMAVGFFFLSASVLAMNSGYTPANLAASLTSPLSWHWNTVFAALWIGPLGTTAGYLFYLSALKNTSVVAMTLFLFLQPLAGAMMGYFFLGERLGAWQMVGSGFILMAILLPNLIRIRNHLSS